MNTFDKFLFEWNRQNLKKQEKFFDWSFPVSYSRNPYKAEFGLRHSEKYLFGLNFKETDKE